MWYITVYLYINVTVPGKRVLVAQITTELKCSLNTESDTSINVFLYFSL